MNVWNTVTFVALVLFAVPFLLFVGVGAMMFRELMSEDEAAGIVIKIGFSLMVVGLIILLAQIIF